MYNQFVAPGWIESEIGFAKSFNGGATWANAQSIISNIRGIRANAYTCGDAVCNNDPDFCHIVPVLGGGKYIRTNSFPAMDINMQTGEIYIVWTNRGVPGVNTGDPDIYMIKSFDQGGTWGSLYVVRPKWTKPVIQ